MIAIVAVAIADEHDVAVAERSAGPPLRACSVAAVVVAVVRPRRQRRQLTLRNDVEKFGDDVEDQDPSHPRWVDFPTTQVISIPDYST